MVAGTLYDKMVSGVSRCHTMTPWIFLFVLLWTAIISINDVIIDESSPKWRRPRLNYNMHHNTKKILCHS